jgi:hypothetical protein
MPPLEIAERLLLAAALGAVIGLEREYWHKPAGLRTNILIAVGSALFTIVSIAMAQHGGTSDRIAAQIVTGIGFLGGGAILRSGTTVRGMTTAATIWVNADRRLFRTAADGRAQSQKTVKSLRLDDDRSAHVRMDGAVVGERTRCAHRHRRTVGAHRVDEIVESSIVRSRRMVDAILVQPVDLGTDFHSHGIRLVTEVLNVDSHEAVGRCGRTGWARAGRTRRTAAR